MLHVLHNLLVRHRTPSPKTLSLTVLDQQDMQMIAELWELMHILAHLRTFQFLVNFHVKPTPSSPPSSHYVLSEPIRVLREPVSASTNHSALLHAIHRHALTELIVECILVNAIELVGCASDGSSLDSTVV
ncbi:unnamed protein product [Cyclocybe aegerita]|uniref:Uncharacterized protein n=1 Tax=Cyclocybe aegerita TaxID=1973307 RepID=A0A8S0W873_CYCAE|nr:unnamed protein product [Cyclocybe aegerita]